MAKVIKNYTWLKVFHILQTFVCCIFMLFWLHSKGNSLDFFFIFLLYVEIISIVVELTFKTILSSLRLCSFNIRVSHTHTHKTTIWKILIEGWNNKQSKIKTIHFKLPANSFDKKKNYNFGLLLLCFPQIICLNNYYWIVGDPVPRHISC